MTRRPRDVIADALAKLDARIAAAGVTITVGAEPTFTRRESTEPWWLWQAEGGDKRAFADAVAAEIAKRIPGATAAACPGRHYPDEDAPRFCVKVAWPDGALTVTPDPGVVEVNTAPCRDLVHFLGHVRVVYAAAEAAGLSPLRYRYNGDVVDSGGGGQLTLGGPTPETSPWFVHPALLPRVIRYLNDHPSLSFWFLGECAGSACQSPRPDEGVRERWEELVLTTRLLERRPAAPEVLHASLGPLLVDAAGNSHRAELNIEKLWNPHLPDRGKLGLVEWRAFQMPPTPEQLAAAAALIRAVTARCAIAAYDEPITDIGGSYVHDQMSLPAMLRRDLGRVFADLDAHGVGLGPELEACATSYRQPVLWTGEPFEGVVVTLSRALEFWPLIGDVASQERATSRLVDASSERLEVQLEVPFGGVRPVIAIGGHQIPTHLLDDQHEVFTLIAGLRRRVYLPSPGLHPTLGARDPLEITLRAGDTQVTLRHHAWRPGGGAYDGLPADAADAARRRAERLEVTHEPAPADELRPLARLADRDAWTTDLRLIEEQA